MLNLTIQEFNGEPRMRDIDIAGALGYSRARKVRELVLRSLPQLREFGEVVRPTAGRTNKEVFATVAKTPADGRPGDEYWLNEHQTFYICTQSKTENAFAVTRQIINLFVDWRNGRLQDPPRQPSRLNVSPNMMDIKSLVAEARLTFGRSAGQILWRKMGMPDLPVDDAEPVVQAPDAASDDILLFLQDKCIVSGGQRDWIRSRDLYRAYCAYCDEGAVPPLTQRAFGSRLKALAEVYRCPGSGARFRAAKRSDTGYIGLRLIA